MSESAVSSPTTAPSASTAASRPADAGAVRALARVAVFAAVIAVLGIPGAFPVPGIPVPITAQTLGVMLAGAVLGPRQGAAAVLLLEVLVAAGLPLLSGGRGGLGAFVGPSGGYLLGWVLGALVIGWIVHAGARRTGRVRPTWPRVLTGSVVGGILVIYALGVPVQSAVTGLGLSETALLSAAFLPGDLIKAVLAAAVTVSLHRAYPAAFRRPERRR